MAGKRRIGGAGRAAREATKLALSAAATGHAAAHTVALRSLMMARAAGDLRAMADPEFTRMATEKMAAAALSGAAFAAHAPNLWRLWLGAAVSPWSPWAFAGAAAKAAHATLAPYQKATRANAKRLSGKRRMS